jgi:hypothetical protein
MIRDRYEPLFKELNLTPENADKFTQLIGDMWAKGTEAVSDSTETAKQNMQDAYDKVNKELQSMLGDTGFARYNDFNVEMPARATLKLLENKLGDERLTADQTSRLIGIVMAEPFDLTHGIAGDWDKAYFGSPSELDEHVQQVQQSQQRILQQAATFLSANQLTALATVQTDSLNAQKTQAAAFVQKR